MGFYEKIVNDYVLVEKMNDYLYLGLCGLLFVVAIIIGNIIGEKWTQNNINKQKNPLSKNKYKSLINKKAELNEKITKDSALYEYALDEFPELDFSEENYKDNAELIHLELSRKAKVFEKSFSLLQSSPDEIFDKFCIYE